MASYSAADKKKKSPENTTHHWEVPGEQDREHNFALLKSFLRQHFKCFVQVWFLYLKKDIVHLEMHRDKNLNNLRRKKIPCESLPKILQFFMQNISILHLGKVKPIYDHNIYD